jgi:acetyl/propionyl-CoA carboxylase alpha subunit/acetyl-CoA carboxylase carboxyltransferase component
MNQLQTDMIASIREQIQNLERWNPGIKRVGPVRRPGKLQKVLIANRGEIAKRFFLSLKEEGIRSVAVVTDPDKGQTWYEMADEVVMIGSAMNYTHIPTIIGAAILTGANAIYPGYGFLSENPDFVEAIHLASQLSETEIIFMGPDASIMRRVGNKLDARMLAKEYGVPLFEGSENISDINHAKKEASRIGYPVIVKLNAGGGGKGMQAVFNETELAAAIESCQRIGRMLYQDDTCYLEKFIVRPVHIEVQIFNGTAIGIRKCAVQRRNQKIVEESGDHFLSNHTRLALLAAAENMARISGYDKNGGAGTVEFLYDPDSDSMGFLEMNTRLQVEHPVTDQSLGIDLARWQILLFDGRESEIPYTRVLEKRFIHKDHTIECRIYAEDPENQYTPSPGKIEELDLPTFNGIRCDFGFRRGDRILPDYDPMIGKLIATATTRDEALLRMERALNELYVRGITTNQYQLLRILRSEEFRRGDYTNRLLEEHPELSRPAQEGQLIREAAILAALAENIKLLREKRDELFLSRDLEAVLHRMDLMTLPESYEVEIQGKTYEARFLQTGLNTFYAYLNRTFYGEIELLPALSGENDYTFRFQYRSCPVRVDRRPSVQIIRFPDAQGRIHFIKVKVSARGTSAGRDPAGMMRSPIQGTFVKFHQPAGRPISIGTPVKKGDPIIVLSAMKMETTITAPTDGILSYLIEDGDLSRLELGRTGDGRVVGRPITEGEVLFIIETEADSNSESAEKQTENDFAEAPLPEGVNPFYRHIFSDRFMEEALKNPDESLPVILDLCRLLYLGYNRESQELFNGIVAILKELPENYDLSRMVPESLFVNLLAVFTDSKRLFSPLAGGNVSYFRETYRMFARWGDVGYQLPTPFRYTIQNILLFYGVADYRSTAEYEQGLTRTAFLYILRSFHSTRDVPEIMKQVLKHAAHFRRPSSRLINLLRKLVVQEEAEQEHSLAALATDTLSRLGVRSWNMEMTYWVSRRYLQDLRKMKNDPLSFSHIDHQTLRNSMEASLANPSDDLIPAQVQGALREELAEKIEALTRKGPLKRLYSPKEKILIYVSGSKDEQRYFAFGLVDRVEAMRDKDNRITGSISVEKTDIDAVRVLHAYQSIRYLRNNIVDLIIADESVLLDLPSTDPDIYSYQVMMNIVMRLVPFFNDPGIENNIMSIRARSPHTGRIVRKKIFATPKRGRIILNLLADHDPKNPYNTSELDAKTHHLFALGKWPAELWVSECFDPDTAKEILLPSIDKTGGTPVGSRIYSGKIRGHDAVFYFKDSRIAGGATGDLEGRKYVAACWLAIAKGCPLYVWNDGAGANIKQGMVSLNRAGEGFFMNALMGAGLTPAEIYRRVERHDDPIVKQVVDEISACEGIDAVKHPPSSKAFAVAVGVGSSTGLDVYGSSQAAIQVMVDDEQSYRVLTGSAVIKSVTGEDLTNYEIGGARIMSRVTGTVDRVARSNLHLLSIIHEIQELFTGVKDLPAIQRIPVKNNQNTRDADDVLTPDIVRANVDNGIFIQFKEEYYGAGALTGGFGRMAGRPVLVMGPRSNMGLRSFQSMIRAAELLIEARKLAADQVIVLGDEWFSETPRTDAATLRARQDVLKLMSTKAGLRIHIATTVGGLRKIMLHSFCDALIFVRDRDYGERDEDVIRNSATHVVRSINEAFDLSVRIMKLLNPKGSPQVQTSQSVPSLPDDPAQPFDIISSVIAPAFDENSFIEWWREMNDPKKGPCLVTGFATLNGESVAILADQPAIMGGAPDAPGTEKFRMFTELAERNGTPIIMLSNAPGFVPGTRQERLRIQQIGGRSLDVNVLSTVPVVSVVLQQNYGGRQIHAFSKFLRPGTVAFALKNSIMAVMGGSSAFDLFHGRKYAELRAAGRDAEAEELRKSFIEDFNAKARADQDALKTGVLDTVIDSVAGLRSAMITALRQAREQNVKSSL